LNPYCTDYEGQWCKNFCRTCVNPPPALASVRAVEAAGHEIHHAAHLLEQAGEKSLAAQAQWLRDALLGRVQDLAKGIERKDV
jgi:hypothetical protein